MPRAPSSQSAFRQLYFPVCSAGLVYCLSRQYKLADDDKQPYRLAGALAQQCSLALAWVRATLSSGLLQTHMGVPLCSAVVLVCCAMTAAAATALFLGPLTASEASRLCQRLLRYLLAQAVLAGSLGLTQQLPLLTWLPWLAGIGELKMFVALCKDRTAGLSVAPGVTLLRYVRTLCLLLLVLAANGLGLLVLLWQHQQRQMSWKVCLLFALDLAVTAVDAVRATLSCVALLLDEAPAAEPLALHEEAAAATASLTAAFCSCVIAAWKHWQGHGREAFFYRAELVADLAMHALTLAHHVHVWVLHGLSCHLYDALLLLDARNVLLSGLRKLRLHKAHVAATRSLNAAFPDVLTGQPAAGGAADADSEASECVICRERMASAKQLPCGHLFHLQCLRAWLQQSSSSSSNGSITFSCPMCRQPLLLPPVAAAAAAQTQGRQRQLLLEGVSGLSGLMGGSGASGPTSGPSARPSLMSSLTFGFLSAEELQPSAAAAAAAAAQHEARLEQLQDRADSWDRDDALMQQQLDSPGTEASYDDVALQEALVASLQDSAARTSSSGSGRTSNNGSPSSTSGRPAGQAPGGMAASPCSRSSSSRSSSSSLSTRCVCSPAADSSQVASASSAGTAAAAAAGASSASRLCSSVLLQQQLSPNLSGGGSLSPYGSAASSCSASLQEEEQQEQQCEAADTFYSQRFGDPLAESDVVPEASRQPSSLNRAASSVGRACTRVLTSLISRSPSRSSSSSSSSSSSRSASLPCSPAAAFCAGSGASSSHGGAAHAGMPAPRATNAGGAGCSSGSSSPRHSCHHQHSCLGQRHSQQAFTPSPSGSRCSACHKRRHRRPGALSSSQQQVCLCSDAAAARTGVPAAAVAAAVQSPAADGPAAFAKRVLLSKYAALQLDVGQQQGAQQQAAGAFATPCGSSPVFVSPVSAASAAESSPPAAGSPAGTGACRASGAAAGAEDDEPGSAEAAAAALAQLIGSARDPCRRREGGRWGRRRLLGAAPPAADGASPGAAAAAGCRRQRLR
ncbi:hypothetical protein COO60DRAFT_313810 [Scenedesmus sp. NREL 46B-D3]|nr:hypothetical protein COO60DRAFT_313810 [Scenedesmus sp. NREL 46B-D3]